MKFKKSIQTLLLGLILSICFFFSLEQNLLALEISTLSDSGVGTNFQASLQGYPKLESAVQGYPKLESAVDQYLMAMPSGFYAIANVESLKSLMADHQALLVDVREPSEYRSGHIPSAINIPVRMLARNLNKIPSDRPVVLYCTTGYRSSMGVMTLHLLNYDNVRGFTPNLAGWKAAGEAIAY
jgi:rhodanese-related sulfurtransferase